MSHRFSKLIATALVHVLVHDVTA
eukprot:COSAG02_NODE_49753_length_325_cov_0.464602_1_plen_23_part_01